MTNKYDSLVCDDVTYHETGIDISWSSNMGFGHLTFGISEGKWYADTEYMSQAFVESLLIKAAPELAAIISKIDKDKED